MTSPIAGVRGKYGEYHTKERSRCIIHRSSYGDTSGFLLEEGIPMEKVQKQAERIQDATTEPLNKKTTYMVDGRRFVVTPVFRDGGESFSSILMRMMKADVTAGP